MTNKKHPQTRNSEHQIRVLTWLCGHFK